MREESELAEAFEAIATDEPIVEPPKKGKKAKEAPAVVVYRSRELEGGSFRLVGVRPIRNPDHPGLFEWHVPSDLIEKVDRHHHVVTGRIVKVPV